MAAFLWHVDCVSDTRVCGRYWVRIVAVLWCATAIVAVQYFCVEYIQCLLAVFTTSALVRVWLVAQ